MKPKARFALVAGGLITIFLMLTVWEDDRPPRVSREECARQCQALGRLPSPILAEPASGKVSATKFYCHCI